MMLGCCAVAAGRVCVYVCCAAAAHHRHHTHTATRACAHNVKSHSARAPQQKGCWKLYASRLPPRCLPPFDSPAPPSPTLAAAHPRLTRASAATRRGAPCFIAPQACACRVPATTQHARQARGCATTRTTQRLYSQAHTLLGPTHTPKTRRCARVCVRGWARGGRPHTSTVVHAASKT
jgi:hypothetical protein